MEILFPDFNNSLVNLSSSIKKHFNPNLKLVYPSIKKVDDCLKDYKKVVVILLDGMGINIINGNLDDSSLIKRHLYHEMTSVFPPTTVAATNSFLKGCLPGEHGWFGWHQYFKDIDKHIVMFKDEDQYTHIATDPHIKDKYVSYHDFGYDLGVKYNALYPAFRPDGYDSFKEEIDEVIDITKKDEPSFTYAYWDNPDGLIHEYGCFNEVIKANLMELSNELARLEKEKSKDSIVLVIADHGLVDVSPIDLRYYQSINKYFKTLPSLEGRASIFFVNDKEAFKNEFNRLFDKWFNLYTTEEFLKLDIIGKSNTKVLPFLGDYIAIAKDKYYLSYSNPLEEDAIEMKGHHAGITKDEMMIPIVLIK